MPEFIKSGGMTDIEAEGLPRPLGISARLARLLYARGLTDAGEMERFLHPDASQLLPPELLDGMADAVQLIESAIKEKKRIVIYGDYDADGVCATVMLLGALGSMGADVGYRIPSRHTEGYGLNMNAVEELNKNGAKLVITVDNGIKANAEIARLRELGVDVVVTDHHRTGAELPCANAVICHTKAGDSYPNEYISGAGTAFKLATALIGCDAARKFLPLAALATAADSVPLIGENRAIVALGLAMINRRECPTGLNAIAEVAGDKRLKGGYTSRDLVFVFAPRINAAGRMQSADAAVELLLETDSARAEKLARELDALNVSRQQDESAIVEDAYRMVEAMDITHRRALVLASDRWNHGVAGIAASRVAERYNRPTLLFAREGDILTGSARSIKGVNLYDALSECEDCFVRFGGHEFAAGVTMEADKLGEFTARFDAAFASRYSEDTLIPVRTYEEDAELNEMTLHLAEEIELLAPFGEGNPEPSFCTRGVRLNRVERFGNKGQYLRCMGMKADCYAELVGFSLGSRFSEITDMESADVIYTPAINDYNGARKLQLLVKDIRRCAVSDPAAYVERRTDKFIDAIYRNILYNDNRDDLSCRELCPGDVKRLITGRTAGTLILCFTPEGAERLLRETAEISEKLDVRFHMNLSFPAAYHTAVLAPVLEELTIARFSDVVVYDTPVCGGFMARLGELAPGAAIYAPKEYAKSRIADSLRMDRERFIPYYKAVSKERPCYNLEVAADRIQERVGGALRMARAALDIMLELGFIEVKDKVRFVPGAQKRELDESLTYRALNEMADALKM